MATSWENRFETSVLWTQLDGLRTNVSSFAKSADAGVPVFVDRFLRVIEAAEALKKADARLVTDSMLQAVSTPAANALQEAQRISGLDPNALTAAELGTLDSYVDQLAAAMQSWPAVPTKGDTTALKNAASQMAKFNEEQIAALRAEITSAREQLEGLGAQIADRQAQLAAMDQRIAAGDQQISQAITAFQGTFDTQQEQRTQQFADLLATQRTGGEEQIKTLVETSQQKVQAAADASEKKLDATDEAGRNKVAKLDDYLEQAENTLEAIGTRGMAGGYQEYAKTEGETADRWRMFALSLGMLTVAALAYLLFSNHPRVVTLSLPSKLSLSGAILVVASYCARQSHIHRRQSVHAHDVQLRMQSLPAYLANLAPAERDLVIQDLAYLFFYGTDSGSDDEAGFHPTERTVDGIMKALRRRQGPRPPSTP